MTQSRDRAFCYRTWVERQRMRRCDGGLPAAAASAGRAPARAEMRRATAWRGERDV